MEAGLGVDTAATAPLPDHLMADTTEDRLMAVTEAATKRRKSSINIIFSWWWRVMDRDGVGAGLVITFIPLCPSVG